MKDEDTLHKKTKESKDEPAETEEKSTHGSEEEMENDDMVDPEDVI